MLTTREEYLQADLSVLFAGHIPCPDRQLRQVVYVEKLMALGLQSLRSPMMWTDFIH